jgi:orotidine-5'-phosphate decarboxylase
VKIQQIKSIIEETKSNLCVGIDPPLATKPEDRINFANKIIDETYEYACSYKINRQYVLGLTNSELREINEKIHDLGLFSIIDHKLSDIGVSNEIALKYSSDEGFDFITISPFPGNTEETAIMASKFNIGTILLTLMSNPEAIWTIEGAYETYALLANKFCEGMVVGTTNHVKEVHLRRIHELAPNPIVLAPGLGSQGGNIDLIAKIFGTNVLYNVSRGISETSDYKSAAKHYHQLITRHYA